MRCPRRASRECSCRQGRKAVRRSHSANPAGRRKRPGLDRVPLPVTFFVAGWSWRQSPMRRPHSAQDHGRSHYNAGQQDRRKQLPMMTPFSVAPVIVRLGRAAVNRAWARPATGTDRTCAPTASARQWGRLPSMPTSNRETGQKPSERVVESLSLIQPDGAARPPDHPLADAWGRRASR